MGWAAIPDNGGVGGECGFEVSAIEDRYFPVGNVDVKSRKVGSYEDVRLCFVGNVDGR